MEEFGEYCLCGWEAMHNTAACPKLIFVKASYSILCTIVYFRCRTKNLGEKSLKLII